MQGTRPGSSDRTKVRVVDVARLEVWLLLVFLLLGIIVTWRFSRIVDVHDQRHGFEYLVDALVADHCERHLTWRAHSSGQSISTVPALEIGDDNDERALSNDSRRSSIAIVQRRILRQYA